MCKDIAFDLSKVAGSIYYICKERKIVACRFNRLGVQRATIPTDRPHFFLGMVFADGTKRDFHSRTLPRIYFTVEDAINDINCIADLPICGYHLGLTNHGHHFAKELLDNGNTAKVGYIWKADEMKAVKITDMPLYDYVNGKFFASPLDFSDNTPIKVYATESECVKENASIEVVEFDDNGAPDSNEDTNKSNAVVIEVMDFSPKGGNE